PGHVLVSLALRHDGDQLGGRAGARDGPRHRAAADGDRAAGNEAIAPAPQAVHHLLDLRGILHVLPRPRHLREPHRGGLRQPDQPDREHDDSHDRFHDREATLAGALHPLAHRSTLPRVVTWSDAILLPCVNRTVRLPDWHAPPVAASPRASKHSRPAPETFTPWAARSWTNPIVSRTPVPLVSTSTQRRAATVSMWSCDWRPKRSAVERAMEWARTN